MIGVDRDLLSPFKVSVTAGYKVASNNIEG
jgi:hypothetical protein